jgi:Mor family transcriptional regulator
LVLKNENRDALERFGRRLVNELGADIALIVQRTMVEELGGLRITVPDLRQLGREFRNKRIIKEFNGVNHKELAQRFGLSVRWVRRIVNGG